MFGVIGRGHDQYLMGVFRDCCEASDYCLYLRRLYPHGYFYVQELTCPFVEDRPLRYSIGQYFGKRRVVIARFACLTDAKSFLADIRKYKFKYKFDLLDSFF